MNLEKTRHQSSGFTIVEIALSCLIFPIIVIGLANGYESIRRSYVIAREFNQIYSVLSACPEIDRALEYDSVTSATNCYPNNSFLAENTGGKTTVYAPTLTVTDTTSLAASDPLQAVPSSKVIDIKTNYKSTSATPLELRMLITRNGIGQQ